MNWSSSSSVLLIESDVLFVWGFVYSDVVDRTPIHDYGDYMFKEKITAKPNYPLKNTPASFDENEQGKYSKRFFLFSFLYRIKIDIL